MQDQRRWLALLTADDGAIVSHLVFIANNSLSDDLIAARWAERYAGGRGPLLLGLQTAS